MVAAAVAADVVVAVVVVVVVDEVASFRDLACDADFSATLKTTLMLCDLHMPSILRWRSSLEEVEMK
jgi:hypothetical protein